MAITVYEDVILPRGVISAGVSGANVRKNTRTSNQAGFGSINVNWSKTLRQFELGVVARTVGAWAQIEGLHEITDGGAFGFLMEDPKDSATLAGQGVITPYNGGLVGAAGFGFGVPTYQLQKRYTVIGSTRVKDRSITRPKTTAVVRGVAPVVVGVAAGNIGLAGGLVTFVPDATRTVSALTVGATTQVTLATAIGLVVGDRLWLQGLAGADAVLLNNLSHAITAVAGAVYTLSTNTAGKAITAAGQGHKYPQPSEALTWTGGFFIPVHFVNDSIDWELEAGGEFEQRLVAGPSVMVQEIRE